MAYYYLMSSLPLLRTDGESPISYEHFLELCKDQVSPKEYEILKSLSVESCGGPLISEWAKFYSGFKSELTYERNRSAGRKAERSAPTDEGTSRLIASAVNHKNPLLAEEMLLALQFQKLDELVGIHYFDDHTLNGYALKLKLLERKSIFQKESGKKEFKRITDILEEQIMSMEE